MKKYINNLLILLFTTFFISCVVSNTKKEMIVSSKRNFERSFTYKEDLSPKVNEKNLSDSTNKHSLNILKMALTNKTGELFIFNEDGTATVKYYGVDLGTYPTNNNYPNAFDKVQLYTEGDKKCVYVGNIGLNGGMWMENCIDQGKLEKPAFMGGKSIKADGLDKESWNPLERAAAKTEYNNPTCVTAVELTLRVTTELLVTGLKIIGKCLDWLFGGNNENKMATKIKKQEKIIENKNKEIKKRDVIIESQNNTIENQATDLANKDEEIKAKDEDLKAKDKEILAKDEEIKAKDEDLKAKDKEILAKDEDLKAKDEEIKAKDEDLKEKDEIILLITQNIASPVQQMFNDYDSAKNTFKNTASKINFVKEHLAKLSEKINDLDSIAQESAKEEAENIEIDSDLNADDNAEYTLKMSAAAKAICNELKKLENREKVDLKFINSIVNVIKEKKKKFDKYLKKQTKVNKRAKKLKTKIKTLDDKIEKLLYFQENNSYDGYETPKYESSSSSSSD